MEDGETTDYWSKADWLTYYIYGYDRVGPVEFSPDGSKVLVGLNGSARVWDVEAGRPVGSRVFGYNAHFSPDGEKISTVEEGKVALWSSTSGKFLENPLGKANDVTDAIFSPDGSRILTTSKEKIAQLWDAATGSAIGESIRAPDGIVRATFGHDASTILVTAGDKTARLWDARSARWQSEPFREKSGVRIAELSPDGTKILLVSGDEKVASAEPPARNPEEAANGDHHRILSVRDAATGKVLGEPLVYEGGAVESARFAPDGKTILCTGGNHWRTNTSALNLGLRLGRSLGIDHNRRGWFGKLQSRWLEDCDSKRWWRGAHLGDSRAG